MVVELPSIRIFKGREEDLMRVSLEKQKLTYSEMKNMCDEAQINATC